jgi:hypothetical protein
VLPEWKTTNTILTNGSNCRGAQPVAGADGATLPLPHHAADIAATRKRTGTVAGGDTSRPSKTPSHTADRAVTARTAPGSLFKPSERTPVSLSMDAPVVLPSSSQVTSSARLPDIPLVLAMNWTLLPWATLSSACSKMTARILGVFLKKNTMRGGNSKYIVQKHKSFWSASVGAHSALFSKKTIIFIIFYSNELLCTTNCSNIPIMYDKIAHNSGMCHT